MRTSIRRTFVAATATSALAMTGLAVPALASHSDDPPGPPGSPGDPTIIVPINDSAAGGTYYQPFERAYAGATAEGTPVYVYVPVGALDGVEGVHSLDPAFDHNPDDTFVPCADQDPADYVLTQAQINYLGDELANQIVQVNEDHFGPMDAADPTDPASDSLVTLVYNVQDENYYDCTVDTYTAGYFAPDFIDSLGMNVIVLDAFDWANRVGEDPSTEPWGDGDPANDRPELYEGVIAHELEHLLMNYSDPGELSWVDEGLADVAAFLNGYDMTGSHLTYQQVFHRETSLTRWGGGLENYGASFSYFAYLWEQAGGNGDGSLTPNLGYDDAAGDLLVKLIFAEQADSIAGVQNAIDAFNARTGAGLRSAEELFRDWAVTMYLDDEDSSLWDLANFDLGPTSGGWTIDIANSQFWDDRGSYQGAQPGPKWNTAANRPDSTALPFGVSYEKFRNPGPRVALQFDGEDSAQVAPHSGETHWWGGYASQSDTILDLDTPVAGGATVDFWTWHFIEEGWDYGFVEALVGGEWVTVPVTDVASGAVVSTNENPHSNNTEGNGITGTSGGTYFVDEPQYLQYRVTMPDGATDLRWRYSTDAAYLDTGWFIDDITVNGADAVVSSEEGNWIETTGEQDNNWTVQVIATCDLTPGTASAGEVVDDAGNHVYRFTGDDISTYTLSTKCANGPNTDFVVSVSNLPSGDLTVLDAGYDYSVVKTKK
ncbi:hypothetical protein [Georgenia yuyongxinii]|uniref:Peptidase M6-like domain-containing protein n=1 Tax=Georgenia yuyongxinii TaxID=2589797 RepID=A0A552WTP4_9MICO|nr:hypothetical protein [Georgenia yuyongxinii]TRW46065.1 hypothetical protein FJ693_07150 [Georgenia yuyongxinii]